MPDPMSVTQEQVTQAMQEDRGLRAEIASHFKCAGLDCGILDQAIRQSIASVCKELASLTHTEPQDASRPSELAEITDKRVMAHPRYRQLHRDFCTVETDLINCAIAVGHHYNSLNPVADAVRAALRTQEARPEAVDAVVASGLIAEPWELEDPDILDRLREEGMFEAVEEIEGLQERCRLAALSEQPRTDAAGMREMREMARDLAKYPCENVGKIDAAMDLEVGCCGPCRARHALGEQR